LKRRALFGLFFSATALVMLGGVATILRGNNDVWLLTITGIAFLVVMGNLVIVTIVDGL
jgi:hypothetical protein